MGTDHRKPTRDDPILDAIKRATADEDFAVTFIEELRWGAEPKCALCESPDVYRMTGRNGEREKHKRWRCRACKKQYTVRTASIFEESRISLSVWCLAIWRVVSSKKGMSAVQLVRECAGISYPTALYLLHRIRFAMQTDWSKRPPLTGTVEMDETFIGGKPRYRYPKGESNPNVTNSKARPMVAAMVERGGNVRIQRITGGGRGVLEKAIRENIDESAKIMTDDWSAYRFLGKEWPGGHGYTAHSHRQYALPDGTHSNTAESVFSLVKRGIIGTWHSISKHRLPLYMNEFEFRWNSRHLHDSERFVLAVRAAEGKRLYSHTLPPAA